MDYKLLATIFITIFLAELGDKTQLATLLYAADGKASPWLVFIGASLALVLSSAIGVLAGQWLSSVISPRWLQTIAGAGFVLIGAWTLWGVWRPELS